MSDDSFRNLTIILEFWKKSKSMKTTIFNCNEGLTQESFCRVDRNRRNSQPVQYGVVPDNPTSHDTRNKPQQRATAASISRGPVYGRDAVALWTLGWRGTRATPVTTIPGMGSQVNLVCGTRFVQHPPWNGGHSPSSTACMGGGLAPIDNWIQGGRLTNPWWSSAFPTDFNSCKHPPSSGTCTKRWMMASATSGSLLCIMCSASAQDPIRRGNDSSCWSDPQTSETHGVLVVGPMVLLVILPTTHPWFVACPRHGLPGVLVIGLATMSATCSGTSIRTAGLEHTGLLPTVFALHPTSWRLLPPQNEGNPLVSQRFWSLLGSKPHHRGPGCPVGKLLLFSRLGSFPRATWCPLPSPTSVQEYCTEAVCGVGKTQHARLFKECELMSRTIHHFRPFVGLPCLFSPWCRRLAHGPISTIQLRADLPFRRDPKNDQTRTHQPAEPTRRAPRIPSLAAGATTWMERIRTTPCLAPVWLCISPSMRWRPSLPKWEGHGISDWDCPDALSQILHQCHRRMCLLVQFIVPHHLQPSPSPDWHITLRVRPANTMLRGLVAVRCVQRTETVACKPAWTGSHLMMTVIDTHVDNLRRHGAWEWTLPCQCDSVLNQLRCSSCWLWDKDNSPCRWAWLRLHVLLQRVQQFLLLRLPYRAALRMKLWQLRNLANRLHCPTDLESPVPSWFVECWLRAPMASSSESLSTWVGPSKTSTELESKLVKDFCSRNLMRRRLHARLTDPYAPLTVAAFTILPLSWNLTTDSLGLRTRSSLTSVSECEPGPQLWSANNSAYRSWQFGGDHRIGDWWRAWRSQCLVSLPFRGS